MSWSYVVFFRKFFLSSSCKTEQCEISYHLKTTTKEKRVDDGERDWVKEKAIKRPCYGQSTYCSTFFSSSLSSMRTSMRQWWPSTIFTVAISRDALISGIIEFPATDGGRIDRLLALLRWAVLAAISVVITAHCPISYWWGKFTESGLYGGVRELFAFGLSSPSHDLTLKKWISL